MEMLAKTKAFVKAHEKELALFAGVFLASFISFAAGYLVAKEQLKTPITVEEPDGK
ncbi:MAG: hypothetical protein Q8P12_06775 [bacterium]|nr:hypothetical protein [bacterium]